MNQDAIKGLVEAEAIIQSVVDDYYEKADSTRLYRFRDRWSNNGDGAYRCLSQIQDALAKARSEE